MTLTGKVLVGMLFCVPFYKVNKYCLLDRGVNWLKFLFVRCGFFFFWFGSNEGAIFCVLNLRERTTTTDFCNFLKHVSLCSGRNLEPLGVFHLTIWRLTVGRAPVGTVFFSAAKDKQMAVWKLFTVRLNMQCSCGSGKGDAKLDFCQRGGLKYSWCSARRNLTFWILQILGRENLVFSQCCNRLLLFFFNSIYYSVNCSVSFLGTNRAEVVACSHLEVGDCKYLHRKLFMRLGYYSLTSGKRWRAAERSRHAVTSV